MSESARLCQAATRLGAPCKNLAQPGSKYCAAHRRLSARPEQVKVAIEQVDEVAEELRQAAPAWQPPPYSPQALLALLQQNAEQFAGKIPVLGDLRRNLEGTTPEDLVDPETWKGLWYVLNYSAQLQSKQALDAVFERLAQLPGGDALLTVKATIEGTSPKDLVDPETWKGAWVIANALVQAQANEVRRRLLGQQDD